MKYTKLFSLPLLFLLVFTAACTKPGTGGKATLITFPMHHDRPIPNATVYIKYGAKSFPGADVGAYDDHQVANIENGGRPSARFEGLRKGTYYLYCVGYDSSISLPVSGGIPITIKDKKGETDVDVPITE